MTTQPDYEANKAVLIAELAPDYEVVYFSNRLRKVVANLADE